MALDNFRRRPLDPERPNYRFFPNRTRHQTLCISWGVLLGGAMIGLLMLDYFNKRQVELSAFYADLAKKGNLRSSHAQASRGGIVDNISRVGICVEPRPYWVARAVNANYVLNQNAQLQEVRYRARRASLCLPKPPKPALEIKAEDEK